MHADWLLGVWIRGGCWLLGLGGECTLALIAWLGVVLNLDGCRVRINAVGIVDIMSYDGQGIPDVYLVSPLLRSPQPSRTDIATSLFASTPY
jgi:hypothetical protein